MFLRSNKISGEYNYCKGIEKIDEIADRNAHTENTRSSQHLDCTNCVVQITNERGSFDLTDNIFANIAFVDKEVVVATTNCNDSQNEPIYCVCQQVAFGRMIMCSNKNCSTKWYHFPCVSLKRGVKGKWYCPACRN